MTSTPLTSIEGALALPSLRPLDRLSEPFGRDWALLPTGQRWQAEFDSLYAALLRTVCIRNRQLLSYGQRVSIDSLVFGVKRPVQAPVVRTMQPVAEPANTATVVRPDTRRTVPEGPMRIAIKTRSPRIAQRRTVWHRRTVTAIAGAIGCVALLAWWMVDQPLAPRRMASDLLKSMQAFVVRRDAPVPVLVEKRHAQQHIANPEAPVIAEAVTATPALPHLPGKVTTAAAPVAASPQRTPKRHSPAPRDAIHSPPPRRGLRTQTHPPAVARHTANESSHEARMQTRSDEDEYADVTTFAMMSLRDVAPPSRAAMSTRLPADSTEWMNHMSQRRVTEIPEQFAH